MKSFIKKVMVIAVVLASITDWPVETKAINGKAIEKTASLLKGCSKSTKKVEEFVNKATQETEKVVNEAAENPNIQRGAAYGSYRMLNNTTRGNAQTTSQPRLTTCFVCKGKGSILGRDGYVYSCNVCKGTGKVFR